MADRTATELGLRIPTLPDARTEDEARRARNWRRVGLGALWLLVAAALAGWLGLRMATTTATADGWTLQVHAPQIIRGALDAPVTITVSRDTVFDQEITLQLDRVLFDHLDVNLIAPAPSAETGTPDLVEWTFDPPDATTLKITIDARLSPSEMPGVERLRFAVLERGEVVVEVSPRLVVLP